MCWANCNDSKVGALLRPLVFQTCMRTCVPFTALRFTLPLLCMPGDKSRKGSVDAPIAALVQDLNTRKDMYTTSSCSGRISIFGEAGEAERVAGKKGGEWLLASHDTVDVQTVLQALREGVQNSGACSFTGVANFRHTWSTHLVNAGATYVLRYEAFILAAECESLEAATWLVNTARYVT